jgi:hypothetical protein
LGRKKIESKKFEKTGLPSKSGRCAGGGKKTNRQNSAPMIMPVSEVKKEFKKP